MQDDNQLYYQEFTPSGYGISIKIKKVLFAQYDEESNKIDVQFKN